MKTTRAPDPARCADFHPRGRHNHAVGINRAQAADRAGGGARGASDAAARPQRGRRAQALGWAKARVTARVKILELPEAAQQLVGEGVIALGAIDNLLAVGRVSPELLDALVAYINDNRWAADRLSREPGWVLGQAMREGQVKTFGAYLNQAGSQELEALRLGKKAAEQLAEAERLHRQIDRYAYGPPAIRFTDADVDQARAAGVLIEFDAPGRPIIVDPDLYRELVKAAIKRTHAELETKAQRARRAEEAVRPCRQDAE